MWVTIFIVLMPVGVPVAITEVVFSAVHYEMDVIRFRDNTMVCGCIQQHNNNFNLWCGKIKLWN